MTAPATGILFYEGRAKPLNTTGGIQPGAYYQFYTTGTLTPATVYADGALSTPLSQVPGTGGTTAASDGRLVPIYLNPSVTYRYQLYSATNVLLEDVDPFTVTLTPVTGEFTDGSAISPSITFQSDPTTGIYKAATDTVGIAAGGVEQAFVNTSGTTFINPITVNAAGSVFKSTNTQALYISASFGSWTGILMEQGGTLRWSLLSDYNANGEFSLYSHTTGAPQLIVTGSGNFMFQPAASGVPVSIGGSTTPGPVSTQLQLVNTGLVAESLHDITNGIETVIGTTTSPSSGYVGTFTSHEFDIRTGNIGRITISSGGNIVANAAASGTTFSLTAASGSATALTVFNNGTNDVEVVAESVTAGDAYFRAVSIGAQNWSFGSQRSTGNFVISQAVGLGTQHFVITNGGGVVIGPPAVTATPSLTVNGTNNSYTSLVQAASTSGQSFGLQVNAGTGSTDRPLLLRNAANSTDLFSVKGDGTILGGGANVDMTPQTATATGTLTGCTTAPTTTVRLVRIGNMVTCSVDGGTLAVSNTTACTLTGAIPVGFQPAREQDCAIGVVDNSTLKMGFATVTPSSSTIQLGLPAANFTASGNKGFGLTGTVFSYLLI